MFTARVRFSALIAAVMMIGACGSGRSAPTPAPAPVPVAAVPASPDGLTPENAAGVATSPAAAATAAAAPPRDVPRPVSPITAAAPQRRAGALPPPVPGRPNIGGDQHQLVGAESIGTIEIPRIGLVHPIFEGTDLSVVHWGPGLWTGSARPGEVGNAVFAGHRVTHTRPFLDIDRLVVGDDIVLRLGETVSVYRVTGHEVVGDDESSIAEPDFPRSTVTLFACHPKGSAAQRYVVRGELVPET